MPVITIQKEELDPWADLRSKSYINAMGPKTKIAVIPLCGGMESGKTSVSFRVDAPSGEVIIFETSLALLKTTVDALVALDDEWDKTGA